LDEPEDSGVCPLRGSSKQLTSPATVVSARTTWESCLSYQIAQWRCTVPNSSIKNEKMYEDLRKEGNSKEKAARISNAAAARGTKSVGRKGGKAGSYDDWSVADLKKRAKELGVTGYSALTKDKLIAKLRNH
jgi:hypothetical protein